MHQDSIRLAMQGNEIIRSAIAAGTPVTQRKDADGNLEVTTVHIGPKTPGEVKGFRAP